jgi:hypothetical protein
VNQAKQGDQRRQRSKVLPEISLFIPRCYIIKAKIVRDENCVPSRSHYDHTLDHGLCWELSYQCPQGYRFSEVRILDTSGSRTSKRPWQWMNSSHQLTISDRYPAKPSWMVKQANERLDLPQYRIGLPIARAAIARDRSGSCVRGVVEAEDGEQMVLEGVARGHCERAHRRLVGVSVSCGRNRQGVLRWING